MPIQVLKHPIISSSSSFTRQMPKRNPWTQISAKLPALLRQYTSPFSLSTSRHTTPPLTHPKHSATNFQRFNPTASTTSKLSASAVDRSYSTQSSTPHHAPRPGSNPNSEHIEPPKLHLKEIFHSAPRSVKIVLVVAFSVLAGVETMFWWNVGWRYFSPPAVEVYSGEQVEKGGEEEKGGAGSLTTVLNDELRKHKVYGSFWGIWEWVRGGREDGGNGR